MRKTILVMAAGLLALGGLAACGKQGDGTTAAKKPKIGVILPDSKSSVRWETADRKYLKAAFEAAGVDYDIQNAQNDKSAFQTIADQMEEWLTSRGSDGFNIMFPFLPAGLDDFVDKVVPELQKRGIFRTEYEGSTLRENLGLPRPKNRFFEG
jgi:hypothetical protein